MSDQGIVALQDRLDRFRCLDAEREAFLKV